MPERFYPVFQDEKEAIALYFSPSAPRGRRLAMGATPVDGRISFIPLILVFSATPKSPYREMIARGKTITASDRNVQLVG